MGRKGSKEREGCCFVRKRILKSDGVELDGGNPTIEEDANNTGTSSADCCRCCLSPALAETIRIAIIGTGLSGLSAALSLEQVGYREIHLYERDESLDSRKEGYGLTLTYDPRGILESLGVLDELSDADCPSRSHYLFDSDGNVRGYFGRAFQRVRGGGGFGQRGNLRVPRQTVREMLFKKLKFSKIHWGCKLIDMIPKDSDEIDLIFEGAAIKESETQQHDRLVVRADIVVGADGIHSRVVSSWIPRVPPPTSLRVRLILGLSLGFGHELLDERGFYTTEFSKGLRLFVMPFAGSRLEPLEQRRFMWQLSIPQDSSKNDASSSLSQKELFEEAWSLCGHWHAPVPDLIRATPLSTVWGTVLYDRDPSHVYQELSKVSCQRVVVVGDALHAMSPFKGQGANQALRDGRTLASWLDPHCRNSSNKSCRPRHIRVAIQSCIRELSQRTQRAVLASRQMSEFWHHRPLATLAAIDEALALSLSSSSVLTGENAETQVRTHLETFREHFKFAGVSSRQSMYRLLKLLQERNIRAGTVHNLDEAILQVLRENCDWMDFEHEDNVSVDDPLGTRKKDSQELHTINPPESSQSCSSTTTSSSLTVTTMDPSWTSQVWEATEQGDLGRLRRLSWRGNTEKQGCMWNVRDDKTGNGLLHLAVETKQSNVLLEWLVREAGCDIRARNRTGLTPLDLAVVLGHEETFEFLELLMKL